MQQEDEETGQPARIHPTRLVHHHAQPGREEKLEEWEGQEELEELEEQDTFDVAMHSTALLETPKQSGTRPLTAPLPESEVAQQTPSNVFDMGVVSTAHLMRLSGMMRAVKVPPRSEAEEHQAAVDDSAKQPADSEEWWPRGIQQTGGLPIVNIYGDEPFGLSNPAIPIPTGAAAVKTPATIQPGWKRVLNSPPVKIVVGAIIGVALLLLVAKFVDIPTTMQILHQRLTTPQGIAFALLSGVAFLLAFSIRGIRWKLFLNPIGKVSTLKAIQLFLVGIFLNFLLPIRGGEVAKSLMLKRIANIPVSQSLPTVAMDKALDLMPALFIMAIVPFLGVQMDIKLWVVLSVVGGLLLGLIFFIILAAWKRNSAINLLQKMTGMLPGGIGNKIAGFATGFVDSLLAGASQPSIFIPAILLTVVAVMLDGLFAMLAFWTIGVQIPFGTAIFGYTVYNMFYILPTPPGQLGSNEAIGLLVFAGLLHMKALGVTAMFIFSHPWAALLMCTSGMACLSALGMTISSAMKVQNEGDNKDAPPPDQGQHSSAVQELRPALSHEQ